MRVRKALTAGVLAVGLAAAAGIGAPAAQAAQADTKTVSASAAAASVGFSTCSDPTPLANEPNSKSVTCLALSGGLVSATGVVTFTSPVPTGWSMCTANVGVFKVNADGTETVLAWGTNNDCTDEAAASSSAGTNVSVPVVPGTTYRARSSLAAVYLGSGLLANPSRTSAVTVLG
jgi:hypothetical protein